MLAVHSFYRRKLDGSNVLSLFPFLLGKAPLSDANSFALSWMPWRSGDSIGMPLPHSHVLVLTLSSSLMTLIFLLIF